MIIASVATCPAQALIEPREGYDLVEIWRCYATTDYKKEKILVYLTRERMSGGKFEAGVVEVSGTKQLAHFEVEGFNRRWDLVDSKYDFIIHPDGDGYYYDLTRLEEGETTKPAQYYTCVVSYK